MTAWEKMKLTLPSKPGKRASLMELAFYELETKIKKLEKELQKSKIVLWKTCKHRWNKSEFDGILICKKCGCQATCEMKP